MTTKIEDPSLELAHLILGTLTPDVLRDYRAHQGIDRIEQYRNRYPKAYEERRMSSTSLTYLAETIHLIVDEAIGDGYSGNGANRPQRRLAARKITALLLVEARKQRRWIAREIIEVGGGEPRRERIAARKHQAFLRRTLNLR